MKYVIFISLNVFIKNFCGSKIFEIINKMDARAKIFDGLKFNASNIKAT